MEIPVIVIAQSGIVIAVSGDDHHPSWQPLITHRSEATSAH